jgi:hypothetical protein
MSSSAVDRSCLCQRSGKLSSGLLAPAGSRSTAGVYITATSIAESDQQSGEHLAAKASNAEDYLVKTASTGLSAERVVTDTTSVTWDWATSGQAKAKRAALTGDVTATADSNATTIAADAVDNTKLANMAVNTIKGRITASTGDPEDLTAANVRTILGLAAIATSGSAADLTTGTLPAGRFPALTGDVTTTAGSLATTIANAAVTYAKMQNVSATSRVLGRKTAGAGSTEECTLSDVLDFVGSAASGDILYRSASWTRLPKGTDGQVLTLAAGLPSWAAGGGGSSGNMTRRAITTADTMVAGDKGNIVEITSGTFTLAFTAAATLTNGWWSIIYNSGTGDVTLDPNSTEQIDGLTTWVLYPGGAIIVMCTGTAFESVLLAPMRKQFDASGTFTKPGVGTFARVQGWGAGGGASRAAANTNQCGGGGGGYKEAQFALSALGTTETVTVGAGGAAGAATPSSGSNGGNTTFGSLLTAYGGQGAAPSATVPAFGGGLYAAAAYGGYYDPAGDTSSTVFNFKVDSVSGWEGGLGATAITTASGILAGRSVYGGGGGGSQQQPAGGVSQFGGNGATAGAGTPAAGSQPGGGGAASTTAATTGSAGGAGRCIVTIF